MDHDLAKVVHHAGLEGDFLGFFTKSDTLSQNARGQPAVGNVGPLIVGREVVLGVRGPNDGAHRAHTKVARRGFDGIETLGTT